MTDQHADFGPDEDSKTSPKATSNAELRVRIARAIHRYDNHHALSGNDMPSRHHRGEAEAVLAELKPELDALAALREVARGYCPACGRGDAAPTVEDWEQQRQRADQLEEILRIAHDTSNGSEAERARAVQRAEHAEDFARRALAQRQEMAAERHAWQERGDRAEAALDRIRALHRKASHGETCVYCAHGQRLGYDTTWPCDTIRALAEPAPGPDTAVRHVHATITNPDPYTANRAALSLVDWITAEFGYQVTTDASERCGSRTAHDAHDWLDWAMHRRCPGHDPALAEEDGPAQPAAPTWRTLQTMVNRVREATTIDMPTPSPDTAAAQAAAVQQRDQYARLLRDILHTSHNISSTDWARWRETLDTITDQEQP